MGSLGGAFGYVYALFFVSPNDTSSDQVARDHIFNLCLSAACGVTVIFAVIILLIRGKPPVPPTYLKTIKII